MALEKLEAGAEYDSEPVTVYHGFGQASNFSGILDKGALVSPNRVNFDREWWHLLVEDILRHRGETAMHEQLDVLDYAFDPDNIEDLLRDGSDFTRKIIQDSDYRERMLQYGSPDRDIMRNNLVWVSRDPSDGQRYAIDPYTQNEDERDNGGYFELEVPESTIMLPHTIGGVPGSIPLDYAENLYLADAGEEDVETVAGALEDEGYSIDVETFEMP